MLKKHTAACLVATALAAVPALAQTAGSGSSPAGSPSTQPGATGGGATVTTTAPPASPAGGAGAAASGAGNINYITRRDQDVLRGSDLIGMDLFGANNEDMGEVDDVLINRNGQVVGLVLGVGGFLGIGETKVAVPMSAVQFRPRPTTTGPAGTGGGAGGVGTAGTGAGGTGTAGAGGTAGTTGTGGMTGTGGAGTAPIGTAGTGGTGAAAGTTDVIVLMVTRDQLRAAPRFEDNAGGATGTGAGPARGGTPAAGTGTAPRQ
jgi:sporulation protein YlmC with PRC-barrel domain